MLLDLVRSLHDNLPAVEDATKRYVHARYPHAVRKRPAKPPADGSA